MKALPLVAPDGCSLSPNGLAAQTARAKALRPAVLGVERAADGLRVAFAPDVDRGVVEMLVATERECCSFLTIDFDEDARMLELRADDARGASVLDELASFIEASA